jgi:amidohydrolase
VTFGLRLLLRTAPGASIPAAASAIKLPGILVPNRPGESSMFTASRFLIPFSLVAVLVCPASSIAKDLSADVADAIPLVTQSYVYLHENPELGKKEFKAHDFILTQLKTLGYDQFVASGEAPTAVIAILDSGRPGPVVALRAEMDARPLEQGVTEPADHQPRSKIDGLMHNCGHDAHASMLLGAASVLMRNKDKVSGRIVFLFQPAEETPGGADDIVHEKILTKLGVEKIFAAHSAPALAVGSISASPGASLAGNNTFKVQLKGRGSHAAAPFEGDDIPLLITHLVQQLSYLPARRLDIANRPVVVSVTKIVVDGPASNVLPTTGEIRGTVRAFEDPLDAGDGKVPVRQMLKDEVDRFSVAHGITAEWEFHVGPPPTINDPQTFSEIAAPLAAVWPGVFDTRPFRGMFSEDFAYYTSDFRSIYFGLGVAKDGLGGVGVHSADCTVSPEAFPFGVRLLVTLARIATVGSPKWD